MLCGLLRIARSNKVPFNFLDKSDARFHELHLTLDSVCTQRVYTCAQTKAAVIISYEDEDLFWRVGVRGYGDLRVLLNMVSSSMLGCISVFVEDKNKATFHFNSLL